MLLPWIWLWCPLCARACCGIANAVAVIVTPTTIAAIAKVVFYDSFVLGGQRKIHLFAISISK